MKPSLLLTAAALVLPLLLIANDPPPTGLRTLDEIDPDRDSRVAWHREARFGCFVHWGVYSVPAGEWKGRKGGTYSEHLMRSLEIPRAVYLEEIVRPFNPTGFDAENWVKLMRDAGMKYLVITAKHHDGFAMYPSEVSDYNLSAQTAFKRDPMGELSAACKKYGLKFGFYYSHAWDWEHPDAIGNFWDYGEPGGQSGWWEKRPDLIPKAAKYVDEKSIPQIRELLVKYQPDIIWFDTSSKTPPELCRRILAAVRETDPRVVINSRIGGGNFGDYRSTADRPAYFPEVPNQWEAIPTTNESYGYKPSDTSHKPVAHFVQLLANAVGKGGNILMNVGPRGDGIIATEDETILRGIGAWLRVNGESIYGCDRSPLPVQPWGASTRKGNQLYLHVFEWPADGKLVVGGLRSNPSAVRLLAGGGVGFRRINGDDVELTLPAVAPDAAASVLVLDFPAQIATSRAIRVAPARIETVLHVMDGRLDGSGIRYGDGKKNRDVTEEWSDAGASVTWVVRVPVAGRFRIAAQYNTLSSENTGAFTVAVAGQSLPCLVKPTQDVNTFRQDQLGEVTLPAGEHTVVVRAAELTGGHLMRLRQLELVPLE
jgi:alpha-L-fucosidase